MRFYPILKKLIESDELPDLRILATDAWFTFKGF